MPRRALRKSGLPAWLPLANRLIIFLNRWGLAMGSQFILTVTGRETGSPRSMPVSIVRVDGERYIVSTGSRTQWVKNARRTGRATLQRGRRVEHVCLVELPVEQRGAVLREFPFQVPGGMSFLERVLGSKLDADRLVGSAAQLPVFRIDRAP